MAVLEKFTGVFPAFYACYDDNGEISRERASKLAEFYQQMGIRGLYVTGSSVCIPHRRGAESHSGGSNGRCGRQNDRHCPHRSSCHTG